jgi:hypothetical protein
VFNNQRQILALKLTKGNVSDTTPVPRLTKDLVGKLFGDKGYIGKKLAEELLRRDLALMTRVRRNMKSLPISFLDKALINITVAIIAYQIDLCCRSQSALLYMTKPVTRVIVAVAAEDFPDEGMRLKCSWLAARRSTRLQQSLRPEQPTISG